MADDLIDSAARNYFRLARLTLIVGTDQIRRCVLDRLPPGQTLHTTLDRNRNKMDDLLRRRVISEKQWLVLYPQNSNVDLARIDITLWIFLLRNVVPLAKIGVRNVRWNEVPKDEEKEWFHDVLRIKETRNSLSHLIRPELDADSFEVLWSYLGNALRRLDCTVNIEEYRTTNLDRDALRVFQQQVNEQVLHEKNVYLEEELHRRSRFIRCILLFVVAVISIIAATLVTVIVLVRKNESCATWLQNRQVGNIASLDVMPRDGWTHVPADKSHMAYRHGPARYVFYTHTAETGECYNTGECCAQVLNIQYMHIHRRHWADIGFHYLVDSKGYAYEGRNPLAVPSAVLGWNNSTMSVALIGNFMYQTPDMSAIGSLDLLLAYFQMQNYVVSNFTLYAMCEARKTDSPGIRLYDELDKLCKSPESRKSYPRICEHLRHRPNGTSHCTFNW